MKHTEQLSTQIVASDMDFQRLNFTSNYKVKSFTANKRIDGVALQRSV